MSAMKYQNRAPRCEHGFMRSVIPCPVCDARPTTLAERQRSLYKHQVISKRNPGRSRKHRVRGYSSDLGGGRQ